ncbi:hypothetical protein PQA67_gp55 [Yersinia phage vB_YenM_56.17]|uniref:Uncharacterized protein n=2 Tax=Duonihilunusvirus TaxID=3044707 RepID=A0AAE9JWV1_9CAUD|nr:hypothetical protein PQA66_gp52 [Yersinia phage vB_YenM_201.16]YP_010664315.1 hypothetical protein PQA67_gp55 [Yersinia phage vB_YenM_56.17]UNA05943.1 hypothetical protein vBYenM5617_055 [Yersinia phage vB_YenM_56.17]UNA05995.1 hypothetical protein vBYenM20116_052 [Yersinia phage vB_YenM_201.16]
MVLKEACESGFFFALINRSQKYPSPFYRHRHFNKQKSQLESWLNVLILKLKFGGPYWT